MGVASWRWEGFVSLDARTRGKLITRPFALANRGLWLNYEIRPGGSVRAGLLDPAGKPLEDFRISDSPWWRGNEVRQVLTWNGRHPASDRPVKLALDLHRARVYGYGLSNPIRGC